MYLARTFLDSCPGGRLQYSPAHKLLLAELRKAAYPDHVTRAFYCPTTLRQRQRATRRRERGTELPSRPWQPFAAVDPATLPALDIDGQEERLGRAKVVLWRVMDPRHVMSARVTKWAARWLALVWAFAVVSRAHGAFVGTPLFASTSYEKVPVMWRAGLCAVASLIAFAVWRCGLWHRVTQRAALQRFLVPFFSLSLVHPERVPAQLAGYYIPSNRTVLADAISPSVLPREVTEVLAMALPPDVVRTEHLSAAEARALRTVQVADDFEPLDAEDFWPQQDVNGYE